VTETTNAYRAALACCRRHEVADPAGFALFVIGAQGKNPT
jgi:hypothetical protein